MSLELEAYEGELTKLRRLEQIIKHEVLAEKLGDIYFICGETGAKDANGLPENILVCPAYGVDWFEIYTRTSITSGPEW